jgi:hypothetical protein
MRASNFSAQLPRVDGRSWWIRIGFTVLLLNAGIQAQTRVSSAEVPSLTGAAMGPFASVKLRDINSSRDHGDGQTTGIANAISDCGTTISCSILVPPTYSVSEQAPGYNFYPTSAAAASSSAGNVTIFDRRFGDARIAVNPIGYNNGLLTTPNGWLYDYYAKAARSAVLSAFYLLQNSWDGGNNQQNTVLGYSDKTQWSPVLAKNNSYTPAQHIGTGMTTQSNSLGNTLAVSNHVYCFGGLTAQGDQGCRANDNKVIQGSVEYAGTLTSVSGTAATTLTVAPTQGANTQGSARFLIKTNAGTLSNGTISNIVVSYNGLTTVTGSGTSWPVSSVVAQLGTSVNTPGPATVTPSGFTTGSMSLITTSTLVCVADGAAFEMIYPSAVSSGGFTANFAKPHVSTATIAAGGVCGYLLDLTADHVTSATYTTHTQTITGTLHFAWPLISSSSATAATLWVSGQGVYQALNSRWDPNSAANYTLYPFAEVTSVQKGGGLSNTLTLGPNKVAWAVGDSVSEPNYPAVDFHAGNNVIESYYPNMSPDGRNFGFIFNSPLVGTDTMFQLTNNSPTSFYAVNGGKYNSPLGVHLSGETKNGIYFDTPSDQWTLGVGCTLTCASIQNILAASNNIYYDFLQYDEANARWSLSASVSGTHYNFGASSFDTPMPHLALTQDNAAVGYVSVQSLRSVSAANTDLTGELALTNASSATYTFLAAYSSHPECIIKPQMDIGSGNRQWVTYSGAASFTVNFASPVSGNVSYSCIGRN